MVGRCLNGRVSTFSELQIESAYNDRAMETKLWPVASSAIAAIGYDEQAEEAYVQFVGGTTYAYGRVSATLWAYFRTAASKGRFVNVILKPRHPCRKL